MKYYPVAVGFAVDILCSWIFQAVLLAVVGGDNVEDSVRRMNASMELQVSATLVGLAFTGVGGYVAASLARERQLLHASAVGVLDAGFGVALLLSAAGSDRLWLDLAALALTVPFAAFGGWLKAGSGGSLAR